MPTEPLVLGIETSCDETGVGIVRGRTLLANEIASSASEHERFGGVVPEIAARAHLEAFEPTIKRALKVAGVGLEDIDAIAVTAGPGLAGALMVGVGAAKALAASIGKPIYGVNHLVGHVSAGLLNVEGEAPATFEYPAIALLVSGGHTELLLVRNLVNDTELLGQTLDDAAGEAFDKVARLLDLPYPGGPHIDKAAASGRPDAFSFPRALTLPKDQAEHRFDFSFSGLKTAVWRTVQQLKERGQEVPVADIAASFRKAVIDVLLAKAIDACKHYQVPRLMLGGGVVANAQLRAEAARICAENGVELLIPSLNLATDNGAMIAALGAELIVAGLTASPLTFAVDPIMPVSSPLSNDGAVIS